MRRLAVDAGLLDMPEPPPVLAEIAGRSMGAGESPEDVGRGVRRRWLAQLHARDLR